MAQQELKLDRRVAGAILEALTKVYYVDDNGKVRGRCEDGLTLEELQEIRNKLFAIQWPSASSDTSPGTIIGEGKKKRRSHQSKKSKR